MGKTSRTREVAQLLRVLTAFDEEPGLVLAPTCDSHSSLSPVLGNLIPSSDHCGHQAHTGCTYTQAGKTLIHLE